MLRFLYRVLPAVAMLALLVPCARAQDVDVNELIRDTQLTSQAANEILLIWWLPTEFWAASMKTNPTVTPAQIDEVRQVVQDYVLVAIADGKMGPFGGVAFRREEDFRAKLTIVDAAGNKYPPLSPEQLKPDLINLLGAMGPVLTNMIGQLGANMHFYVFPANDADGKPIADAIGTGHFTVSYGEKSFRFRLPLGSLLAKKTCPKCSERLNGAYQFCPYDGTTLPK
jgi:hypothetical protein